MKPTIQIITTEAWGAWKIIRAPELNRAEGILDFVAHSATKAMRTGGSFWVTVVRR